MTNLERKKKELELARVQIARQDLELKIEIALDEIKRLEDAIQIQIQAEQKIKKELE